MHRWATLTGMNRPRLQRCVQVSLNIHSGSTLFWVFVIISDRVKSKADWRRAAAFLGGVKGPWTDLRSEGRTRYWKVTGLIPCYCWENSALLLFPVFTPVSPNERLHTELYLKCPRGSNSCFTFKHGGVLWSNVTELYSYLLLVMWQGIISARFNLSVFLTETLKRNNNPRDHLYHRLYVKMDDASPLPPAVQKWSQDVLILPLPSCSGDVIWSQSLRCTDLCDTKFSPMHPARTLLGSHSHQSWCHILLFYNLK